VKNCKAGKTSNFN